MKYLITEGLADTVMVYLIIKKLSKPFKEWDAYKEGLIDENGKKLKTAITFKERKAWTVFDRFIANLKKIMSKFVGKSRFAAIATSVYLLKDSQKILVNNNLLMEATEDSELTANLQLKIKKLMNEVQLESCEIDNEMILLFMIEKNLHKFIDKDLDFLKMGEFINE